MNPTLSPMADALAQMPRGLADPVHDAQAVFRSVLEALSRPGRLQTLPGCDALQAPPGWSRGLTAVLLTLLDADTSLHLHGALGHDASWRYLTFHTGVQREDGPSPDGQSKADFAATRADDASLALLNALAWGDDDTPQDGATLVIDAPRLSAESDRALQLTGPGIQHPQTLGRCGLPEAFWRQRIAMQAAFPRGVDLLIVCGSQLVGLPRSTHVALNAKEA